ncbi:MAG: hypothetical protein RQ729_00520 [Wenzhouxiangellaceae bacterium]|nr:hypothetical protein [Wenzhouxiangellaceae bacterium]
MRDFVLLFALLLPTMDVAAVEIYRCEQNGVIEFSDRPCADDAAKYQPGGNLSVVGASEDLGAVSERNRQWVEQRREALAEQRALATEQARRQQQQAEADALSRLFDDRFQSSRSYPSTFSPLVRPRLPQQRPARPPNPRPEQASTPADRRTLLSRSGGNGEILRDEP